MPISVVFDPPLPSDSPSTFNTKAFTLLGDLNDWSTQANALPGEVATNLTTLLASPPAIGSTTPAAGSFTTLSASGNTTLGDADTDVVTPNAVLANNIPLKWKSTWPFAAGSHGAWVVKGSDDHFYIDNFEGDTVFRRGSYAVTMTLSAAGAVTIPGSVTVGTLNTASASVGTTNVGLNRFEAASSSFAGDVVQIYGYSNSDTYNALRIVDNGGNVKLNVRGNGAVTIPGSLSLTGGTFGYGIGAGGTVTQATSKSTAVTLNKPCGQITMNNAALAANTAVAFQVNNNLVAVSDVILVSITDSVTSNTNYQATISQVVAGAFNVCLRNITSGSLSETLVFNFSVVKGATS